MPYIMKIINTSHLFDINKKIDSLEKCMHFTAAVNKSLTSIIIPHFQEVPNSKKMGKKNTFLSLFLEMNSPLDGILVHCRLPLSSLSGVTDSFAGTSQSNSFMEIVTVTIEWLPRTQHNTVTVGPQDLPHLRQ